VAGKQHKGQGENRTADGQEHPPNALPSVIGLDIGDDQGKDFLLVGR
jgi:hypothetical protein